LKHLLCNPDGPRGNLEAIQRSAWMQEELPCGIAEVNFICSQLSDARQMSPLAQTVAAAVAKALQVPEGGFVRMAGPNSEAGLSHMSEVNQAVQARWERPYPKSTPSIQQALRLLSGCGLGHICGGTRALPVATCNGAGGPRGPAAWKGRELTTFAPEQLQLHVVATGKECGSQGATVQHQPLPSSEAAVDMATLAALWRAGELTEESTAEHEEHDGPSLQESASRVAKKRARSPCDHRHADMGTAQRVEKQLEGHAQLLSVAEGPAAHREALKPMATLVVPTSTTIGFGGHCMHPADLASNASIQGFELPSALCVKASALARQTSSGCEGFC
jgi:hypothetical protein